MEKNSDNFINIKPASEFIPEWYRLQKSTFDQKNELVTNFPKTTTSTYKKCTPFYDAMTIGYIIFLTADVEVQRQANGLPYIVWRTTRDMVTEHNLEQWDGMPVPTGYSPFSYKWHNQMGLSTPKDYSLFFTSPINRFELPFITISGVVDTDSYELAVQLPFFVKNDFTGIIKQGTPLAQIIPIKRETWNRKIFKYDEEFALSKGEKFFSTIKRSYKNNHWFRKEYK